MKDSNFAKALFGDGLLEGMRVQVKNKIKKVAIEQFAVIGVVLLLGTIDPDAILEIAEKALADVKHRLAGELGDVLMDEDEFEALFSEASAEVVATFEKMRAAAVRAEKRP
jgi:hypothetical protein